MSSIITSLKSESIARLKCGIGQPELPKDLADFVLASPKRAQNAQIKRIITSAIEICEDWVASATQETMNRFNGRKEIV